MLRYLRDSVADISFYVELDLIAGPFDPKNLFGLVADVIVSILLGRKRWLFGAVIGVPSMLSSTTAFLKT